MFKLKDKKIKHMKDIFEIEAHNIVKLVDDRIGKSFDLLCEVDKLKTENNNLKLDLQEKELEIKFKEETIAKQSEDYQKLYDYAYKLVTIIQSDREKSSEVNQKLLDEIADLKSDHYVKVKVPEGKTPGKQKVGAKSSAVTSKIIKKVKE